MDFESGRSADIINHAIAVKQDIFDQLQEILGEDVTENDAVIFFSALSVMCKLTSQLARAVNGCQPAHIKQLLREDCARSKIILNQIFPNVIPAVTAELKSDEIPRFLEEVEFFEYPDSEIAKWNLSIEPKLNVAQ